ncbi:MAG: L,D-transpeptidase [Gammaproteobacteria bacterium]|nr:L,D-transpeptidase [Gammaproteobacteria bacterium]
MNLHIVISIAKQELVLLDGITELARWPVSTATNGPGEKDGSLCTPRGRHIVAEKFGAEAPVNAVFVGRRATGETWTPELAAEHPDRDWILTRILWLEGLEEGRNRGDAVDSKQRYIYIHGTPDSEPIGEPASHGCIRMRNADVVELFDRVPEGTPVDIEEGAA